MKNKQPFWLFVESEKALKGNGISHLGVVDRWSATPIGKLKR